MKIADLAPFCCFNEIYLATINQLNFSGMKREIFTSAMMSALLFVCGTIFFSCGRLNVSDEGKGTLFLKFERGETTKAVVREFPDSNLFILKISRNGGGLIYEGKYGERPADIQLEPGNYDVEITSRLFSAPEFDAPCYADKRSVVVQSGTTTNLSLLCRQVNSGLRLLFGNGFRNRFGSSTPVVADIKGESDYIYSESRFLYLTPGLIEIKVGSSGGGFTSVTRREIAANEMLTLSLDAVGSGGTDARSGVTIDTVSVWLGESFIYGQIRDGASKERALTVEDIRERTEGKDLWICGYIAGYLTSANLMSTPPFNTETNLAIAESIGEQNKLKCVGIALPSGAIREALNLKANPGNIGKKLYIKGDIVESYFGGRGINNIEEFVLE